MHCTVPKLDNTLCKKERMRNLLLFTLQHYNKHTRATDKEGMCIYYDSTDDKRCAIGLHLEEEHTEQIKKFPILNKKSVHDLVREFQYRGISMPENLEDIPLAFLSHLQCLHDCDEFWDENGVNEQGQLEVNGLSDIYKLGEV